MTILIILCTFILSSIAAMRSLVDVAAPPQATPASAVLALAKALNCAVSGPEDMLCCLPLALCNV